MKSILLVGIIAAVAVGVGTASFEVSLVIAQMADNATMGNMTGGNMTMEEQTNQTGSISGAERLE